MHKRTGEYMHSSHTELGRPVVLLLFSLKTPFMLFSSISLGPVFVFENITIFRKTKLKKFPRGMPLSISYNNFNTACSGDEVFLN